MKQIAIITGGSSGIGLAAAQLFAKKGYKVYELSRSGQSTSEIEHIKCDMTDEEQVKSAVKQVLDAEGHIDLLINNAGYGISGAVEFTTTEDAKCQFDVNLFGALNAVKAVLPTMRQQKSGKIIFTSSVAAVLPIPYQSFYSASKAAINALTLALRNEVAEFGIKVSALMPGDVKTGFTAARNKNNSAQNIYTKQAKAVSAMEKDEQNGMTTNQIAQKLLSIARKNNPAPLYTTGLQYHLFVLLEKLLPKRFSNWVVGKIY